MLEMEDKKRVKTENEEAEFIEMIDQYYDQLGEAVYKQYENALAQRAVSDMPEDVKTRILEYIDNIQF